MGHTDPSSGERPADGDCSTSDSFADHDISKGIRLMTRTRRRLDMGEADGFEPSDRFFDRLEEAFMWAYLESVEETGIPPHVEAAIADAKAMTAAEFDERPDADLRTDVVPTFYQHVAGFHCAYRGDAGGGEAS